MCTCTMMDIMQCTSVLKHAKHTRKDYKHGHTTRLLSHTCKALSRFHTQAPTKQTSTQMRHYKLKIPLLPLVVERMQKWPTKWSLFCI